MRIAGGRACPRLRIRFAAVVGAVLLFVARPRSAHADGSRPDFAFGHPGGEGGLAAFAAASNFTYLIPQARNQWAPRAPRAYDAYLSGWSDLTGAFGGSMLQLGIGYAFEAAYLDMAGESLPGISAFRQTAIEAESLLLTSGITALIKRVSGRCRPREYRGPDEECVQCDSFPSGHTSVIASFSGARFARLTLTPLNEAFPLRFSSFVISEAAMGVTGLLRVLSGSHSWDDVVVGAIVGHATGVTVALLHWNVMIEEDFPTVPVPQASPKRLDTTPILFTWGGAF